MSFEILGRPELGQRSELVNLVDSQFFSTLLIPLLQGRLWTNTEDHNGAHLVVINQTMARLYFPNSDAIGHFIRIPSLKNSRSDMLTAPRIAESWLEVIGVVGDSRDDGLRNPVAPAVFVPWTFYIMPGTQIIVRSNTPPLGLLHRFGSLLLLSIPINSPEVLSLILTHGSATSPSGSRNICWHGFLRFSAWWRFVLRRSGCTAWCRIRSLNARTSLESAWR